MRWSPSNPARALVNEPTLAALISARPMMSTQASTRKETRHGRHPPGDRRTSRSRPSFGPRTCAEAADRGFRLIINNRPDGEAPDQPTSARDGGGGRGAGLDYVYIPVRGGADTRHRSRRSATRSPSADGPVLAFCRSGTRSIVTWAHGPGSWRGDASREELIGWVATAGYDLSGCCSKRPDGDPHRAGGALIRVRWPAGDELHRGETRSAPPRSAWSRFETKSNGIERHRRLRGRNGRARPAPMIPYVREMDFRVRRGATRSRR